MTVPYRPARREAYDADALRQDAEFRGVLVHKRITF
jgi:hypothetical protein